MTKTQKIQEIIRINKHVLQGKYGVKTIGIFGSYARGDYHKKSDLDVLVDFSRPIGFFDFIRLEEFLSKVVGQKVDLVSRKALKPVIKKDILKETVYV